MEDYKKGGNFSADGRKLRPRKKVSFGSGERRSDDNRRSFGSNNGERRSYGSSNGERRSYSSNGGERRSYGSSNGERRSYGAGSGEHRSYGSNNGERRPYGAGNGGERRSYGSSNGERRSYGAGSGERRPYGSNNGERRPYGAGNGGERRSYGSSNGERRSYGAGSGERRSYGSSNGERRPYGNNGGERRSSGFGGRSFSNGGRGGFNKRGNNNRPYKRFEPQFDESAESGINQMISRKPQLDSAMYSDNDYVPTPIKDEMRLNKFIANSGVCSRREADTFIQAGVVTVNGEVVTELGTKVNVSTDDIRFNGERLKGEEKVYIVMNKPKGYVTTSSDPHAEKTVMELLKGCPTRVFPVGRLDKATTGVLMFTNDGEIAEKLTHPAYDKKKIYQVMLDHELTQEDYDKILSGVALSDGDIAADELEFIDGNDHRKLGIEIHSGKNRIVRRIFESLGYDVKALDRVYFAGLTKKGVSKGEWRYLSEGEVNILKMGAYV